MEQVDFDLPMEELDDYVEPYDEDAWDNDEYEPPSLIHQPSSHDADLLGLKGNRYKVLD